MTELSHAQISQLVYLTTAQAAKLTGLGKETIKRAAKSGDLPSFQATEGGWHRFTREDLDTWLHSRRVANKAAS